MMGGGGVWKGRCSFVNGLCLVECVCGITFGFGVHDFVHDAGNLVLGDQLHVAGSRVGQNGFSINEHRVDDLGLIVERTSVGAVRVSEQNKLNWVLICT